jgi:hypothetical protein
MSDWARDAQRRPAVWGREPPNIFANYFRSLSIDAHRTPPLLYRECRYHTCARAGKYRMTYLVAQHAVQSRR